MSISTIYVTTQDRQEAETIARLLVQERLIACANIHSTMISIYRWEGKVQQDDEAVLMMKTHSDLVDSVIDRVKELHSYDCPCVVSWPVAQGNEDYLKWVDEQVTSPDQ